MANYAQRDLGRLFGRVMARVHMEPMSGCWLWVGPLTHNGYGRISLRKGWVRVHRVTYEHSHGSIPEGMEVDHKCRQRCCANPDHLRAVTHLENLLCGDGVGTKNASKTHCDRGHPLSGDNLSVVPGRPGHSARRRCRTCTRASGRRHDKKRRAAKTKADPAERDRPPPER